MHKFLWKAEPLRMQFRCFARHKWHLRLSRLMAYDYAKVCRVKESQFINQGRWLVENYRVCSFQLISQWKIWDDCIFALFLKAIFKYANKTLLMKLFMVSIEDFSQNFELVINIEGIIANNLHAVPIRTTIQHDNWNLALQQ